MTHIKISEEAHTVIKLCAANQHCKISEAVDILLAIPKPEPFKLDIAYKERHEGEGFI